MKGAVLALGIIGAIFGIIAGLFAFGVQGFGNAVGATGTDVTKNGLIALLGSITGLVGAVMVFKKPKISGWLMIGSAIVGFVATFVFYILAGILLLVGGILALTIKKEETKVPTQVAL